MKESAVFALLADMAAQLDIQVSDVNMRAYSYGTKSGLCRVRGEYRVIIDKHLHLSEKIDVLVDALQELEVDLSGADPAVQRLFRRNAVGMHEQLLLQPPQG